MNPHNQKIYDDCAIYMPFEIEGKRKEEPRFEITKTQRDICRLEITKFERNQSNRFVDLAVEQTSKKKADELLDIACWLEDLALAKIVVMGV